MLDKLEFILSEALTALRRNAMMTVSAVNTAAIALFVLGGLGYVYLSLNSYISTLPSKFEITISIKPEATPVQISEMATKIRSLPGVARVVKLPKDITWRKFIRQKGLEDVMGDVNNPLPDQFLITLDDLKQGNAVKAQLANLEFYDKRDGIKDAQKEREYVSSIIEFVQWFGILLGVITFFTAGTLILNSVYLTVLARRNEIRIMRLVGASQGTIRWPYLLEGGIQGALGGMLAGLLLWAVSIYIASRMTSWFGQLSVGGFVFPAWRITLFLTVVGGCLGTISAMVSVRKYLKAGR